MMTLYESSRGSFDFYLPQVPVCGSPALIKTLIVRKCPRFKPRGSVILHFFRPQGAMACIMLGPLTLAMTALSPVPPALNEYSRGGRGGTLANMRRSAAAAVGRALADDLLLLEIEFPPLCETKTQFDDYSNTEVLDANRDFAMQFGLERELSAAAPDATMWMCFADDGESELAREAWPGTIYKEATITSIIAAVSASGADPFKPFGSWAVKAKAEEEVARAKLAPAAALQHRNGVAEGPSHSSGPSPGFEVAQGFLLVCSLLVLVCPVLSAGARFDPGKPWATLGIASALLVMVILTRSASYDSHLLSSCAQKASRLRTSPSSALEAARCCCRCTCSSSFCSRSSASCLRASCSLLA